MVRWTAACVALLGLTLPAQAWEVVGASSGLPTFALADPLAGSTADAGPAAFDHSLGFETVKGGADGYSYRIGKKYLFGFESATGFSAGADIGALAAGFDVSRSSMKFGYDMGAFKPFVTASFANVKGPAFGANLFAGPPGVSNPFAPTASATTVGAGFDYAITDNLHFGMSLSATQTSGWSR